METNCTCFLKYCCNVLRLLSDLMIRKKIVRLMIVIPLLSIIKKQKKIWPWLHSEYSILFYPTFYIPVKFPHKNMDPDRSAKMKAGAHKFFNPLIKKINVLSTQLVIISGKLPNLIVKQCKELNQWQTNHDLKVNEL